VATSTEYPNGDKLSMVVEQLINEYLHEGRVMQLATVKGDQPWICSVYYVADGQTLYWLSWPTRRHSQEVTQNPKAAATIMIHAAQPVVGIQVEGDVEEVSSQTEVDQIAQKYLALHGVGEQFAANFAKGTNQHHMYKLSPRRIVLFDERHFAGDARQEMTL